MTYVYTPYILPYIAAATTAVLIVILMWKRRQLPGAQSFIVFSIACHIWLVGNILEITAQDLATKRFWISVEYPAITTVTVAWFLCLAQFTGWNSYITRTTIGLMAIIPTITVTLTWTNSLHGLMRSREWLDDSGPYLILDKEYGPWFWVHAGFSYVFMASAVFVTIYALYRYRHLYRGHAILWLSAGIIPAFSNVVYIFDINPLDPLDMTPIAFTFSGALLLRVYQRFSLFDIIPTARDHVIQSMEDAVIVLDPFRRIADVNPAARKLLQLPDEQLIGRQSEQIFARWPKLIERYLHTLESRNEIALATARGSVYYDLQISPLYDGQQRISGRVIVLRDMTTSVTSRQELEAAKNALEIQHQKLRNELQLAHGVQIALLPKQAPWAAEVLPTACTIYPAQEVGGDFYTFINNPEEAVIVIGDISGKGVSAALLMALLVNAVEDCVREESEPAAFLGLLQERVSTRLQASNMLACIQIVQYNHAQRRVKIANAGMIAPILVRNGHAELLETYGLPIGTGLEDPEYLVVEHQLQPQDTLVLSSDGLIEAQNNNHEIFGFERFFATLENIPASRSPQYIISSLIDTVHGFQNGLAQHDDQTLVIIQVPY